MTPLADIIAFVDNINGSFHLMHITDKYSKNKWYCAIKLENAGITLEARNHAETAIEAAHNAYLEVQLIYSKIPAATFNNNILEAPKSDIDMLS